MNKTQYVLVVLDPYESGEVTGAVGPFASEGEAEEARQKILDAGGHPDAEYGVFPISSLEEELKNVEGEYDEDEEGDEEEDDEG